MPKTKQLLNDSVYLETKEKLESARSFNGKAYSEKLVNYQNIAEMFLSQVEKYPDKTYLVYRNGDEREEFTYKEILVQAYTLAAFMYQELDIRPGDKISTVAYNHHRTVVVYYAALLLGAVLVPINIGDNDERIKFVQENSETKAVFVMPDLLERYNKIKSELKGVESFFHMGSDLLKEEDCQHADGYLDTAVLLNRKRFDNVPLEELLEKASAFADLSELDDEALVVYTSGTTGEPKGVVLEQYNVLVNAQSTGRALNYSEKERMMIVLPIHHVNGLIVSLITSMYYGASVILNRKFSSSNYWQIVKEEKATCGSVVPTILAFLCEAKNSEVPKNFYLLCGAGPLTVDLVKKFLDACNLRLIHGYGLSETTAFNCFVPLDIPDEENKKWLTDYGYPSIGTPMDCNEMSIHDEDGKELEADARGEIVIRGHDVMKYYFKRPDSNAETFKNGWFRTGDEGFYKLDSKNRKEFFITGRLKEIIIRGGVNHSTFEIDEILNEIPGVKSAMAVGFENDYYGEEIGAYLVLEDKALSEKEILDYCSKKLPYIKQPKVIVFGEEFPVTATGKYKRNELKPLFSKYKSVQFNSKNY